jgi:hypothetical protein
MIARVLNTWWEGDLLMGECEFEDENSLFPYTIPLRIADISLHIRENDF